MVFENNQNVNAVNPPAHVEGPAPAGERDPGRKDKRGRSEKSKPASRGNSRMQTLQQDKAKIISVGDDHIDFRA